MDPDIESESRTFADRLWATPPTLTTWNAS